jgi:hypothetical protein
VCSPDNLKDEPQIEFQPIFKTFKKGGRNGEETKKKPPCWETGIIAN